ncbi:phosphopantetheine attachment site family protein [Mycobacterium ulcerans str. Harvey]|uniref:Phosphopantetheine attachment site family protein n=1 Tax=Mycobacterium ulcerans str. Harvey TaxID=1299332 RepID=A0ABN0QSJ6_MYCUL|nr:phosphopantetheine attachment site family protein [Mycobacterium ulcerans str. Harvey]
MEPLSTEWISRDEIRAAIAAQLDCPAADVADDDDLIQLGLNSIRMMSMAGRWRKRGADITFAQLAATATVQSWHELLNADQLGCAVTAPADRPSCCWNRRHHKPRSRWQRCSTPTGSVALTNKSSAALPPISTLNSTEPESIPSGWNVPCPTWLRCIRCCVPDFSPTGRSRRCPARVGRCSPWSTFGAECGRG